MPSIRSRFPAAVAWASVLPFLLSADLLHAQGVRGVVRDAADAPIADVALLVDGREAATTRGDGRFRLDGLPPGPIRLTAERLGHGSVSREVDVP
ncbi:MAG: carboxypeptidase-like regulatory domain-containing protein, partial [Longimicrobiales bacterium]